MQENQIVFGIVSDNKDPGGLNRIRVYFPFLKGAQVTGWIPYVTPMTGSETGVSILPEIDTPVLVTVLNPDWTSLIAHPAPYNEKNQPPKTEENSDADLNEDGKNSLHFIKSRLGYQAIMDDSEGDSKILILTPDKKTRITIDGENGLVSMETDKAYTVEAKGTVTIRAENLEITAEKELTASSETLQIKTSKAIDILGDKDITVKGSGVSLN
jgi:uncharacterized protein involved in type VI secretion and phage assembly